MATRKHTPTQLEEVKARVAKLDRMGWTQVEIARDVKVTQGMVSQYLKAVREETRARVRAGQEDRINELLATYADIRAEAWREWERSRTDATAVTKEVMKPAGRAPKGKDGKPARTIRGYQKRVEELRGRLGGGNYLAIILDTIKEERDLLGLDAPKKVESKSLNLHAVWEAVAGDEAAFVRLLEGGVPDDPVEARLAAEAALTAEHQQRQQQQLPPPATNGDGVHTNGEDH